MILNKYVEDVASKSAGSKGRPRYQSVGDHRHRKSEKEEDEELINQVKRSETLIRLVSVLLSLVYVVCFIP